MGTGRYGRGRGIWCCLPSCCVATPSSCPPSSDAALQKSPGGVAVCRLDWEEAEAACSLRCDVAVASDVLYDPGTVG
jgi:hypothetical protein